METTQNQAAFNAAVSTFINAPSTDHLALLTVAAQSLVPALPVIRFATTSGTDKHWQPVQNGVEFAAIRIKTNRTITEAETDQVTVALNSALNRYVGFDDLTPAYITHGNRYSILEYNVNSQVRRRKTPNFVEAFVLIEKYIQEGSPERESDRAGLGTTGTKACTGIGLIGIVLEVHPL